MEMVGMVWMVRTVGEVTMLVIAKENWSAGKEKEKKTTKTKLNIYHHRITSLPRSHVT